MLEACSESEYGSWEFWSDGQNKTVNERDLIIEAIISLVKEENIFPTEYKYVKDQSYQAVTLDENRLRKEIDRSMTQFEKVDPDAFYWFLATEKGKKEDISNRS
ncbi:hypothetical protein KW782_00475 [Candidatus Parcubacteria bacterium]|nr:hypothetical protein [Candidatus Parcubacteria bacterium]